MTMVVVEVIPITSSILTESLSYFSSTKITVGTLVTIPLRKKEIKGIVLSISNVRDLKQNLRNKNFKIKSIIKAHKENIFSEDYIKTINKLKSYCLITAGKLIDLTYPKYILNNFEFFLHKNILHKDVQLNKEKNKFSKKIIQKSFKDRVNYYKKYISNEFKKNKSVHIICPTILSIKNISVELRKYIDKDLIYILHGKVSNKKIIEYYNNIKKNNILIISTPIFLDIPIKNRSTIILENDSSNYYRQAKEPFIDLRIFIEEYSINTKLSLIISDNILRPARFYEKHNDEIVDMNLFSSNKISLINVSDDKKSKQTDSERIKSLSFKKEFSPFSKKTINYIKKSIDRKENIFFYTQRKGLAPNIICNNCGKLAQDITTGFPYSLYTENKLNNKSKKYFFVNNLSNNVIPAFDTCQFCGSWRLQTIGIGTETIHAELLKLFPDLKDSIKIIDSRHVVKHSEFKKTIRHFDDKIAKANILIGTQKALPYIKEIDSSFIISIDGIFYMPGYENENIVLSIIKNIYDNSNSIFIQTRISNNKKNIVEGEKNIYKDNDKKIDELKVKFSQRLINNINRIKYSDELQRQMYSKYSESLEIWNTIRDGDYNNFIKKYKKTEDKNKVVIKIKHIIKRKDYLNTKKIYEKKFIKYNFLFKKQSNTKKDYITLIISIFIDKNMWNTQFQDENLYKILPINERNINIEINPINFL